MLIGTTNIASHHGKQHTVVFSHNAIRNESEWGSFCAAPFFDRNRSGFKEWTVTVVVKDTGREAIIADCSAILSLLAGAVDLTLDGFSHKFRGILTRHDRKENAPRRYHMLELTFEGYEYGTVITVNGNSVKSFSVNNTGNLPSPCVIEITPTVGAASITLKGVCRDSNTGADLPVKIANLESGKKVVIDGLSGLITQDGKQKGGDVDIWALPSMKPGKNTITVDNDKMNITIKTTPLFM